MSADGKVWTFHLRKTARWTNGDPVTARDFHWAWRRALLPATKAAYPYLLYDIVGARAFHEGKGKDFSKVGVKVVDDRTLRVTLVDGIPYLPEILASPIASPLHRPTVAMGDLWTRPVNIVSNGPFRFAKSWRDGTIRFAKNKGYWNAAAIRLERMDAEPMEREVAEERFVAGELDWIPGAGFSAIKHAECRVIPTFITYFLRLNTRRGPLKDRRVREAIACAIDRDAVVRTVLGARPWGGMIPAGTAGHAPAEPLMHDPKRAQALLKAAGYAGEKTRPLTYLFNENAAHAAIAGAVGKQLNEKLGLVVRLKSVPWDEYQAAMRAGRYHIARGAWIGDYNDPETFAAMWRTDSDDNRTGYSSAIYDRLHGLTRNVPAFLAAPDDGLFGKLAEGARLRALVTARDAKGVRMLLFKEMERLIVTLDCPIIPIYQYTARHLIKPHVRGFHPNLLGVHPLRGFWIERR